MTTVWIIAIVDIVTMDVVDVRLCSERWPTTDAPLRVPMEINSFEGEDYEDASCKALNWVKHLCPAGSLLHALLFRKYVA